MDLALDGPGADGAPAHKVGIVLPKGGLQELGTDRQAKRGDVRHEPPGGSQALRDVEGLVEVRVVDQALPPEDRPRLLEVDPHRYEQAAGVSPGLGLEEQGVVERRGRVVDRAGAHDHKQAVVPPGHDRGDLGPRLGDPEGARLVERDFPLEHDRGGQRPRRADAEIVRSPLHAGRP